MQLQLQGLALVALTAGTAASQSIRQVFNFSSYVDIENSHLRPNGHLLLSTFDNGRLYTIDPSADNPQAELVSAMPGATALCGITSIGDDKYAVVGGIRGNYSYTNETIYTVDYSGGARNATIAIAAHVSNATMLNGMDSLPEKPHVILLADSRQGAIYRVDTDSGVSTIVIQDEALAAPSNATLPIGVNGLKIRESFVYYTNSARNTFGRVPITVDGDQAGDVEVVAQLNGGTAGYDWDDFVFDEAGVAYAAQPTNAIAEIKSNGQHSIFVGGGNNTLIQGPTSITIARDGKTAYVTTHGDGTNLSGQVLVMQL
ncbi:uncharacterized protein TRUGW13939_04742 [Talaromyces rugulosus]|uniref:SMP-30/Gluconolactonase/LRE-like region domain-containing protein n=1 Tax=Talaromyces rugulosus TaxID=121627 RepID=A0A7H8QUD9_TALRU|nr:uncharacterized protein TRUGW13939_04742 [Talaromyces rugulosus]QKX57624.1 hypothetical protein TRUGW13939_04742 [Talaromyces rugulosus]